MNSPGQGEHRTTGPARYSPAHRAAIADVELKRLLRELAPFGALSKKELATRVGADRWHDGTFEAAVRVGVESGVLKQLGGDFIASRERPLVGRGDPGESATARNADSSGD